MIKSVTASAANTAIFPIISTSNSPELTSST
jgi:hypothetical protein